MVSTVKFSEFADINLNESTNKVVGVGAGANFKGNKVVSWSTAGRPASPYNGLIGLNTDLQQYEFYDADSASWVQLGSSSAGMTWNDVTTTSANMVSDNGYMANNIAQVVLALPATCSFGSIISIAGYGSGGWRVTQNAGQTIVVGSSTSTVTTGYIESTQRYNQIDLICTVADTVFVARNTLGNLTIV